MSRSGAPGAEARSSAGDGASAPRSNPLASVLELLGTLVALTQTRLELMATEVEQEKRRLLAVMAWGAVAVLLGCFGLLFLALLITAVLWDTHRLLALGLSGLFFVGGALAAWSQVRRRLDSDDVMLSATVAEFEGDRVVLESAARAMRGQSPGGADAQR